MTLTTTFEDTTNHSSTTKARLALLALMLASFAIGTTEFITTGLLPNIAQHFHISIPTAGLVTSLYALGVVIGAPLLTLTTLHLQRKTLLANLMLLFLIGSIISATATTFSILLLGRILSAFAHGAFFGAAAIVATQLVSPDKKASAIALMFTGLTLANVIGVPLGTFLGQQWGWHMIFWVITLLGVIGLFGIVMLVPHHAQPNSIQLRLELQSFQKWQVWKALLITSISFSGLLASFAYVAPMAIHISGFSPQSIPWLLMLYGLGLVIGNVIGGKAADKHLTRTLYTLLISLASLLFLFSFLLQNPILTCLGLFLLGCLGFGVIPPLQMQVLHYARHAPNLASAANIAAFNLGVFMGVSLAGTAIHLGYGYASPNWVGGILTTLGLLIFTCGKKT